MRIEHIVTAITVFSLIWALVATVGLTASTTGRRLQRIIHFGLSYLTLGATLWISSVALPGRNSIIHLGRSLADLDPHHLCAVGLGCGLGLAAATWPWSPPEKATCGKLGKLAGLAGILTSFVFLGLLALQNEIAKYWTHRDLGSILTNPTGLFSQAEFELEEYHRCNFAPVQIAIGPAGKVYYCHLGDSGVARLDEDTETGKIREVQVAFNLTRVHGIAFYKGELYISRSGRYTRAKHGQLEETNTGAVTLLRDLDGDGTMDYYHDVVTGLLGAQAPDPVHQNNGITFSSSGHLYTTVGSNANKGPTVGEFEGTIIQSREDGSGLRVFARGMRNPFDCTVGPDDELFCTDNDVGFGHADELNHVVDGGHYGHPYVDPYIDPSARHPRGTIGPIWLSKRNSLQGIAYTESANLPQAYRNCLYVVGHPGGEIYRVQLRKEGETYDSTVSLFANIPQALDIAIDSDGTFYVSAYHTKKIYRLRRKSRVP